VQQLAATPLLSTDDERVLTLGIHRQRELVAMLEQMIAAGGIPLEQAIMLQQQLDAATAELQADIDQMFAANIRLVLDYAGKVQRLEFADQFQWGCVGLIRAIALYDPYRVDPDSGRLIKFSTYATYWIMQFVQRGADSEESLIRLPVHVRDLLKRLSRSQLRYIQQHGVWPTLEELCSFTGEDIAKVRRVMSVSELPLSIHTPYQVSAEDGGFSTLENLILDQNPDPETAFVNAQRQFSIVEMVTEALTALENYVDPRTKQRPYGRHAQVLRLRFRVGEEIAPEEESVRTLEEVGTLMRDDRNPEGITRERTRQLQRVAVKWLQEHYPDMKALLSHD
jgi:RNA polymerase primary sigma factor